MEKLSPSIYPLAQAKINERIITWISLKIDLMRGKYTHRISDLIFMG